MTTDEAIRVIARRREELNELCAELGPLEEQRSDMGELSHADQHPSDTGTETADRTASLALLEQLRAEIGELEEAVQRVNDGSYGLCEICNGPIGDDRLYAMPGTRRCVLHASNDNEGLR